MNKSLNTPLMDLTYVERRDMIQFAKKWCAACFGVNNRHSKRLSVRCIEPDEENEENGRKRLRRYIQTKHSFCSSRISGKPAAELQTMVRSKRRL